MDTPVSDLNHLLDEHPDIDRVLDLQELLHEGYEKIYANLPEQFAMANLLRNVQAVVSGQPLKNDVSIDVFSSVPGARAHYIQENSSSIDPHLFDDSSNWQPNGICDLRCNCDKWLPKQAKRRKGKTPSVQAEGRNKY